MSHHFDTDLSRKDPRLNICDFYLFDGRPGMTTMVMTTNGDVGLSSPNLYHPEGVYAFRFDRTGRDVEDLVFKLRFGEPTHVDGDEHRHSQSYVVVRAEAADISGIGGEQLLTGKTGEVAEAGGVKAFAGIVPELWAADALGFRATVQALLKDDRLDRHGFVQGRNWFERRNVMAIVLEVPNTMIGDGRVGAWSTISLFGHAPEIQVCRFGFPLFTFLLLAERPDLFDAYHLHQPKDDVVMFAPSVQAMASRLARVTTGAQEAAEHGRATAARFCPSKLPYVVGEAARFTVETISGRPLGDHALAAMWSVVAATAITDGNAPDMSRSKPDFPYYGAPFTAEDQAGLSPLTGVVTY